MPFRLKYLEVSLPVLTPDWRTDFVYKGGLDSGRQIVASGRVSLLCIYFGTFLVLILGNMLSQACAHE